MSKTEYWGRLIFSAIAVTVLFFLWQSFTHQEAGSIGLLLPFALAASIVPWIVDRATQHIRTGNVYLVRVVEHLVFAPALLLLLGALFPIVPDWLSGGLAVFAVGMIVDWHETLTENYGQATIELAA